MKKLVILGLIIAVICMAVPTFAFFDPCDPQPFDGHGVLVWQRVGNCWKTVNDDNGDARCYRYYPGYHHCNKSSKSFDFEVYASVAQWMEVCLDGTQWVWNVRKPGTFTADCIGLTVRSNNDVDMAFSDMAPEMEKYYNPFDDEGNDSVVTPEVTFAFADDTNPLIPPAIEDFKKFQLLSQNLEDTNGIVNFHKKLFNKLVVTNEVAFGTYRGAGVITFTLRDQKPWLASSGAYLW